MEAISSRIFNKHVKKLAILSLCLGSLLLAGCEAEKTDAEYLASAKQFAAEGDKKSYEIQLKNALQKNPVNPEARYLLGLQYLEQQFGALAEKELERSIEFGTPFEEVSPKIIQAKYLQFRYGDLLEYDAKIDGLSDADKAIVYFYRGLAQLKINRPKEAEAEFDEAIQADKSSESGKLANAYLLSLFKNFDDAEVLIDDILANNPTHTETLILKNRLLAVSKEFDESVAAINKAIELEPRRLDLYITSALTHIMANQNEEAEEKIDKLLDSAPSHFYSNLIKARLRLQAKDWELAREHADKALIQSEVSKEAKLISGIANFYLQNWEIARDKLMSVRNFVKPDHPAHRMLSYTEFKLGYIQSADSIVGSVGTLQPNDAELLSSFGQELAKEGKIDEAVSLFETAAGLTPENSRIQTKLGILKLSQNDASGLENLEKVLEQDASSFWARAALARSYVKSGDNDKAIETAEELIKLDQNNIEGYVLLADIQIILGRKDDAEKTLKNALKVKNDAIFIYQRLFTLAAGSQDSELANDYNEKILEIDPVNRAGLLNYYRLQKQAGDTAPAFKKVNDLLKQNPDSDPLKLVLAIFHLDNRDKNKALTILNDIPAKSAMYPTTQEALGNLYMGDGDVNKAIPRFREWVNVSPNNIKAHQALIDAYSAAKDHQAALESTRRALKNSPSNRSFQLREVQLLLVTGREEQAINKANKLKAAGNYEAQLELMMGQYFSNQKEYDRALDYFQRLHKIEPSNRSVIGLAEVNNLSGNKDEALKILRDWLKKNPNSQPVRLYLANLNLSADNKGAIAQYRKLIEENDKNFIALNNLAWALGENGQLSEAITYAEKANLLRPNTPQILDTLGYLQLRNGETEKARNTLRNAHDLDSSKPEITYHYAMALKESGDVKSAKQKLQSIANQKFSNQQEVRQLLKELN